MTASIEQILDEVTGTVVGPNGGQVEIVDVTHDSREVGEGFLFCCVPGATVDGHNFATAAVELGASALLVEREVALDGSHRDVPQPVSYTHLTLPTTPYV